MVGSLEIVNWKAREKKLLGHDMQHYHSNDLEGVRDNTLTHSLPAI